MRTLYNVGNVEICLIFIYSLYHLNATYLYISTNSCSTVMAASVAFNNNLWLTLLPPLPLSLSLYCN